MRAISAALGAALLFGWLQSASANPSDDVVERAATQAAIDRERATLRGLVEKLQGVKPDEKAIGDGLKAVLADPAFPSLSDAERHVAYLLYGAVLHDVGDYVGSLALLRQATAMAEAGADDWGYRFSSAYIAHDDGDATLALTMLAQRWPKQLARHADGAIFQVAQRAEQLPDASAYAKLLTTLYASSWRPNDPFINIDELWLPLLRIRLEQGDVDGARKIAAELHDPASFIKMRADKRFDAIVLADHGRYDVAKSFAAALSDAQTKAAAAPDKLRGVNAVATLLLHANRPTEALSLIDAALVRLKTDPKAFSDADDQLPWLKNQRADALFVLGRGDEAFSVMIESAALKEQGHANVDEAINLAEIYNLYDRPSDALAALAGVQPSNTSEYGRMALEDARACPYFQLGDTVSLGASVAYMKAHARDGAQPYFSTMLCIGDLDAAAAEAIAELDDPSRRSWILYVLQDYPLDPHPTKRQEAMHAAWHAVRARPDVAAAIARVGRIESYDMRNPGY